MIPGNTFLGPGITTRNTGSPLLNHVSSWFSRKSDIAIDLLARSALFLIEKDMAWRARKRQYIRYLIYMEISAMRIQSECIALSPVEIQYRKVVLHRCFVPSRMTKHPNHSNPTGIGGLEKASPGRDYQCFLLTDAMIRRVSKHPERLGFPTILIILYSTF